MGECVFLGVLIILSCVYYMQTLSYGAVIGDASGGAGFFPRIVCVCLVLLATIRLAQIIRSKEKKHYKMIEMFQGTTGMFSVSTVILVISMPYLGFVLSGFIYLTVVCGVLRKAKTGEFGAAKWVALREIVFFLLLVGIYAFFTRILFVALPAGLLNFI